MLEKLTIIERLEMFAEAGETSATLRLWKKRIKRLVDDGFTVEIICPTIREGEFYCKIDWKHPTGEVATEMLMLTIKSLEANATLEF